MPQLVGEVPEQVRASMVDGSPFSMTETLEPQNSGLPCISEHVSQIRLL